MITYFKSVTETSTPFYVDVDVALDRIRSGKSKSLIEKVRAEADKEKRNILKKSLPCILFSGEFTKRSDSSLKKHSGLICLDFDGFSDELDMALFKLDLKEDRYTMSVFTSPSGDGLKVLVKIPADAENHKNYFLSLKKHYNRDEFDTTSKNLSRVCYESYDPEIFINKESDVFDTITAQEFTGLEVSSAKPTVKINSSDEVVKRLFSWWNSNYGLVPGQRNNNVFILASAFNEYGIDKSKAIDVMSDFTNQGFPIHEIKMCVESAYKDFAKFNTKFFEDTEKVNHITDLIKRGTPLETVADIHKDVPMEVIHSAVTTDDAFWSRNKNGQISHINYRFKEFIESLGYKKYYVGSSFVFVKIKSNIMEDTNEDFIKDDVMDSLLDLEDMSVYNYFSEKTKLFKEDHLSILGRVNPNMWKDGKDESYLFYNNCVLKVTKDGINVDDYITLDGVVWKNQIIDRSFEVADYQESEFKQFINNVSGNDESRQKSIESTIGYLLHNYKPSGYCPAVIINDEVISDNPEGGTGKGMIVKAISMLRRNVGIDGKMFQFGKSFPYQRVSADTQVLVFDDVNKGFDFERLFSLITEGITVEKKNKDEIFIPFSESPKVIITTNYAIKGSGNSHDRRRFEIELASFYNKNFTPETEFGHQFFSEWDKEEWLRFDNYMINCLQLYLREGLVESEFKNLSDRRLIAETNHEFYEWVKDEANHFVRMGACYALKDIFEAFCGEYQDYGPRGKYAMSLKKFKYWLDKYGDYAYGQKPSYGRTEIGRCITFERNYGKQGKLSESWGRVDSSFDGD